MTILHNNWELFSDFQSELGEGPLWDYRLQCLYWIDILGQSIYKYNPKTGQTNCLSLDQKIGSLGLTKDSDVLIGALKNGFYLINFNSGFIEFIIDPESQKKENRFNDGKVSPDGNFWAGTMDEVANTKEAGALYCLGSHRNIQVLLPNVSCSNGLAWDNSRGVFYLIDTGVRKLYEFDCTQGKLLNQKVCIEFDDSGGIPDGMCIDSEGKLWIAFWNGSKVVRFDPISKSALLTIELPASKVTSCCFGGENLNDLYITTARIGLSDAQLLNEPLAGSTFVIRNIGFKGLNSFIFKHT